jgi:hypothetical protein
MDFSFKCASCGQVHEGMPTFGSKGPLNYYSIPEAERETRGDLGSDDCVIDGKDFFVRGCLEIPVKGERDPFVWGVWVSLSRDSHAEWVKCFGESNRSHVGPFLGWLNAWLKPYPDTMNLKTRVHLRDNGIRPYIELEPTDHPPAIEQRDGISVEPDAEIYALMVHSDGANSSKTAQA